MVFALICFKIFVNNRYFKKLILWIVSVHGFGVRDFWRVRSLVLVGELGFKRVQSLTSRVQSSSKFKDFSKMFIVVGF